MSNQHRKIPVLDRGHVILENDGVMGNDLWVVNRARVSFNKKSLGPEPTEADAKLIKYLATHRHWTPFAHPQISLLVKAPIFIRAQLIKHQVGLNASEGDDIYPMLDECQPMTVINEVSRRYCTDAPEIYTPAWRSRPEKSIKQGSGDYVSDPNLTHELNTHWESIWATSNWWYDQMLVQNVAPEQARAVLPQGAYTEWWWTGSLYAWARIYQLRADTHAQFECQLYALAIDRLIRPHFPISWQTLVGDPKPYPQLPESWSNEEVLL